MEDSVIEVKNNAMLIEDASKTFEMVFDKVGDTDRIIGDMVGQIDQVAMVAIDAMEMTGQQMTAAHDITESVSKLESCIQSVMQNSDAVAENAKALEAQANGLAERMSRFQV